MEIKNSLITQAFKFFTRYHDERPILQVGKQVSKGKKASYYYILSNKFQDAGLMDTHYNLTSKGKAIQKHIKALDILLSSNNIVKT